MEDSAPTAPFSVDGKSAIITGAGSGKSSSLTSGIPLTIARYQLLFRKASIREELQCRDRRPCLASRSAKAHR